MPKVFVSATSRDLKSYRQVVTDWATERGYTVVVQDDFPVMSDYGTIVQMLCDKLAPCDAVIHLVGLFYGFEPTNHPTGETRRSYTQLEYELAKEHKRQVFRFIARPDYSADNAYTQSDEQRELQLAHRQRLMEGNEAYSDTSRTTGNELYYEFSAYQELRALLDKLVIQQTLAKPQNLPLVGSLFKGRDEFLDQLRSVLVNKPTHIAAVTAKQAIHGLGGVGKTRVAVEYAKRFAHEYSALLFITADSESNLRANLAQLCGAMVLNLPEQSATEQEVQVAAAVRWLRANAGWFLIVDNVDTPEAAQAAEALLQKLDTGHVVITSRLSNWGQSVQELALDVLSEPSAVEMLLERTAGKRKATPSDEVDALTLAKDLGCLPLALEQAGAFIVKHHGSLAEYHKRWKNHETKVLQWHDQRQMKYPRSVATTWETSFEQLSDDGRCLLNVLCWLAPDPIPVAMIEKLSADEDKIEIDSETGLADLGEYSLLKWTDETHTAVVVHRLVQEITEYRLPPDEKLNWLKRCLQMMDHFCGNHDPYDVRSWKDVYTPARKHLEIVIRHADQAGIYEPTARLMSCLAAYLYTRAEFSLAEPIMRRALAINEACYGSEHFAVVRSLNNLAIFLKDTNRLGEAEPLLRRALSIGEASYGPDDHELATYINNLAILLHETNRLSEAEPLMRRALEINKANYGPIHPAVANNLNNLASLLQATNRLSEAEPLMRRALTICKIIFGKKHPHVANVLNNLASLLLATNRLSEAERLMRRTLSICKTTFGKKHPHVATALNNLTSLLLATNRFSEAEPLMLRALQIDERSYGPDHPDIARDLINLAELLKATNRFPEAEPLMRRALAIDEANYGPDHPQVATDLNNLASLLQETNRLSEAEPLMRRVVLILIMFQLQTGHPHPHLQASIGNYAGLLNAMNRTDAEIEQAVEEIKAEAQAKAAASTS